MASSPVVEEILGRLRANGGRVTSGRRAILEALVSHEGHPTAEQLTAAVQRRHPDVHESTVYRFLDDLERLGIVDHVHLGHGPAVYHMARDDHSHLVCRRCGQVREVPSQMMAELRQRLRRRYSFDIDLRHFGIPGLCKSCAADARK